MQVINNIKFYDKTENYLVEQKNKQGRFLYFAWTRYSYFTAQSYDEDVIAVFKFKKMKHQ
jgi:hypothetical protein